jgi:acyl-CoA synthetase (AMP-forming)/AMP-acid ligase II
MMLFDRFVERAARAPNDTFCVVFEHGQPRVYSNGAVLSDARRICSLLLRNGIRTGMTVAIILEHRRELYGSFIGSVLAGAIPSFLPPLTRKQDPEIFRHSMKMLMDRLEPSCLIGSATTLATADAADCLTLDVDALPAGAHAVGENLPAAHADQIAFLQHSSGTTGLKKGVSLSHRAVLTQVETYASTIGLVPTDVVASWLPLYHDMGLITSFLMPCVTGIPFVSIDALQWVAQPTALLDAIETYRATLAWMPNFAFHHLVRMAERDRIWDLSSMRMMVNCSEPCRATAFDAFLSRFRASGIVPEALQVSYAMAENVFAVTQTTSGRSVPRSARAAYLDYLSSGRPIPGTTIRILNDDREEVGEGVLGEIVISGNCLFDGYHKLPHLSMQRLRDGWYASGDLGFMEDGELFVVGRVDDVLNINGKKVIAHEIEAELNALEGIAPGRVLVYSDYDPDSGATQLFVAVETVDVPDHCRSNLPAAIRRAIFSGCGIRPHHVSIVDRGFLLKSTSGKISRQASIRKLLARTKS